MQDKQGDSDADDLYSELLRIGENAAAVRDYFQRHELAESAVLTLLRRSVPQKFLEYVATTRPWSDRVVLQGAVAMNPRVPRHLALRLVPALSWADLAQLAATPYVNAAIRWRAEEILRDRLPDMRLGERIALAKLATPRVLQPLLLDGDAKVVDAGLLNPRLKEEDVLYAIRSERPSRILLERLTECYRWRENHAVRLALVLQHRAPLSVALAQLSHLPDSDLKQLVTMSTLPPLVRAAAERILEEHASDVRGHSDKMGN